ncbi:probable oxidoreductase/Short-chain dehydrogenase [Amycolatopsis camponoti]|uniref:Probable oxidoreductase/Short-chain dehydrogenase n=1 Tax=Amycolatopsis camponoti TaxID=2606593 RepID=A0A6I8LPV5_9PSEU|nr:oxidoreductase [Amycolatopsis camponoti]VVJ17556.1 probable oxidoreductase/Short-chain dehydrogenase [Amycolatopsis camponoti]
MASSGWTAADIPDQRGRIAVVTGANSGVGFETARMLAERGARVVLACRDTGKAAAACDAIRATAPDADLRTVRMDLADAASVRTAAAVLDEEFDHIDLVINNAGAAFGKLSLVDGVDRTFVTNQLGPFAFTGLLLHRVTAAPAGRIVTVTSGGHEMGRLLLDDLGFAKSRYRRWRAYTQTKLANVLFAAELQRRLAAAGTPAISVAAHPGAAATEFGRNSGGAMRVASAPPVRWLLAPLVNTAAEGALPTLRAAVDPQVRGGDLYGPAGPHGIKGRPERVEAAAVARDEGAGAMLWERCEQLTGVRYPLP